jgi:hypothetical protein
MNHLRHRPDFWMLTVCLTLIMSAVVAWAACLQRPGPRCFYGNQCPNGDCYKICTINYLDGFGPCQDYGGSEEECTEFMVQSFLVLEYRGSCNGTQCSYGEPVQAPFLGLISSDTTPCW